MPIRFKRLVALVLGVCLLGSLVSCNTELPVRLRITKAQNPFGEEEPEEQVESPSFISDGSLYEPEGFVFSGRVFMVGDSTMSGEYGSSRVKKLDLQGWGKQFPKYFLANDEDAGVSGVRIYNYALSGASSKSYCETEYYTYLMEHLSAGDYLFIQFGHNDEKADGVYGTSAGVSRAHVDAEGKNAAGVYSFEWMLYEKYVRPAMEVGAIPVLLSPNTRRSTAGDANVQAHLDYRLVIKKLAESEKLPFIDMTRETYDLYEKLYAQGGEQATAILHAFEDETRTKIDNTHLSIYGAFQISGMVAADIRALGLTLSNFLLETPTDPVSPRS